MSFFDGAKICVIECTSFMDRVLAEGRSVRARESRMSDILIGVIVFGLVFGAAIFGMFLGRNLRVLEQKVNASDPPSPRLRRAKQTKRSGQVRSATVHDESL